jgi:hypothetical protein
MDETIAIQLMPHQERALRLLHNGAVLYGGVGTGKSITAVAYYMRKEFPKDVYVITTAKKRDSLEWEGEFARFGIGRDRGTVGGVLTVDSWNNVGKYAAVEDAFFIFDEQRVVGTGAWVKGFLRLVRHNRWILLSATPGDTWSDYAPLFIANGYFRNITEFRRDHVVYAPFQRFPKILRYLGEAKLERLRNELLVEMPYDTHTTRIVNQIDVGYDSDKLKRIQETRWHEEEDRPLTDVADLWRYIRRVVNTDPSRLDAVRMLLKMHKKLIIFYTFNYELDILRELADSRQIFEWNRRKHDEVPESAEWVYLVQYNAGSEGWNCTATDAMCFYSLTYSYKMFAQAQGRIDRLNTPYTNLYYYVLKSGAYVDRAVAKSLAKKRDFNERKALKDWVSHEYTANLEESAGTFAV